MLRGHQLRQMEYSVVTYDQTNKQNVTHKQQQTALLTRHSKK